jgi:hypothetical protein
MEPRHVLLEITDEEFVGPPHPDAPTVCVLVGRGSEALVSLLVLERLMQGESQLGAGKTVTLSLEDNLLCRKLSLLEEEEALRIFSLEKLPSFAQVVPEHLFKAKKEKSSWQTVRYGPRVRRDVLVPPQPPRGKSSNKPRRG